MISDLTTVIFDLLRYDSNGRLEVIVPTESTSLTVYDSFEDVLFECFVWVDKKRGSIRVTGTQGKQPGSKGENNQSKYNLGKKQFFR